MGSVIATMAWNTWRHLEIWYGVMGMGGIVHTLNPRLFTDQLGYIVNHAEDQWIFTDLTFVPLLEKLQEQIPAREGLRHPHRRSAHAADHAAQPCLL